jgi:hypothetical protein
MLMLRTDIYLTHAGLALLRNRSTVASSYLVIEKQPSNKRYVAFTRRGDDGVIEFRA